ncbi:MAG TPA: cysteine desulfurase NifS [Lachnospiraceae bacterium]|nr:cysteine desulfurase NifS [Lachnospiraceae bacterium]HIS61350.1 cysteine desulfurase [Candidatus Scybalomonas excrementigallinarum]
MEAYLDNAATTFVFPEVKDLMGKVMEEDFGNPSSLHKKGVKAEQYIKEAKETIAKFLKVEPKEIVFTSGGTESNNMALIGSAYANQRRGKHIITTRIEHASVYEPLMHLEKEGFQITYLPVDEHGIVKIDALKEALTDETILVSIMYVNNEIGSIQPIEEIGKIIKSYREDILFHVDAIQAYGKLKIYPKRAKIDLLSVSGHKIHGPKGSGFLYIKDKTKIQPILFGGGQQKGMRSGTENVPAIAGLSLASKLMYENHEEKIEKLNILKERFIKGVSEIENVTNNSGEAPHIISISFPGVRSEVLLHALEEKGVYVSSGSACSSNHPAISGTLKAIGLDKNHWESTLRFSLSIFTTEEEVDFAIQCLKELVPVLRRFTRR